jgi:hypothetical protein
MRRKRQIPGEATEVFLSFRQRCLAQDICKGGDHEKWSEPSNHARMTAVHDTEVSQGILCQEEQAT